MEEKKLAELSGVKMDSNLHQYCFTDTIVPAVYAVSGTTQILKLLIPSKNNRASSRNNGLPPAYSGNHIGRDVHSVAETTTGLPLLQGEAGPSS